MLLRTPIDPYETDNLANEASNRYNDADVVAKREALAQRLPALEAERLRPLNHSIYLLVVQA